MSLSEDSKGVMRAVATGDIPLERLHSLSRDLRPQFELHVDGKQIFHKSAEPPSWVSFLADAEWWQQCLAAYTAVYVAEIVREAAKGTWANRGKAATVGLDAARGIKKLAGAIAGFWETLFPRTEIRIGLPLPDDYFATTLNLVGRDPIDLELELALFVHHLPALVDLIRAEGLENGRVLGGIHLKLLENAALEVSWTDRVSFETQVRVLPIENVA